jgi:hypothetical protein
LHILRCDTIKVGLQRPETARIAPLHTVKKASFATFPKTASPTSRNDISTDETITTSARAERPHAVKGASAVHETRRTIAQPQRSPKGMRRYRMTVIPRSDQYQCDEIRIADNFAQYGV